jgi:nitroreductase
MSQYSHTNGGSHSGQALKSRSLLQDLLKAWMPNWIWLSLRRVRRGTELLVWTWYDLRRFWESAQEGCSAENLERRKADCLRLIHSLEKAATLPHCRYPFGLKKVALLEAMVSALPEDPGTAFYRQYVQSAVTAVRQSNRDSRPPAFLSGNFPSPGLPGSVFSSLAEAEFFFTSRHSCRNFAAGPIPTEILEEITRWAQAAPSVCNRQGGRVRYISQPALRDRVLALQNGNQGFGGQIPVVAVVSCDLRILIDNTERNQGWIDGALFAMTLVWCAHARGLGTCFLNWCRAPAQDRDLRRLLEIPPSESIITLLALGFPSTEARHAPSWRRPLAEVLPSIT